jgi:hypothetical protein
MMQVLLWWEKTPVRERKPSICEFSPQSLADGKVVTGSVNATLVRTTAGGAKVFGLLKGVGAGGKCSIPFARLG